MILRLTTACLLCLLVSPLKLSADDDVRGLFHVVSDGATVRCGPGSQYYECLRLAGGSSVDVVLKHASGFMAIRPPRGSTSWVAAEDLRIRDARTGEVVRPRTVSWIGSQTDSPMDHRWQVELPVGSRLTIHGQQTLRIHNALPTGRYYRITPPAGEYRWIHESELEHEHTNSMPGTPGVVQAAFQGESIPTSRAAVAGPRGWRNRNTDQPLPLVAGLSTSSAPRDSAIPVENQLLSLEARLSQAMASEHGEQQLVELSQALSRLSRGALEDEQRQHVARLLQTTHRFRQLRQQRAAAAAARSNSIYDVAGWLMKVHAGSRRAPPFAILDSDGQVLEFASPAPGLNLHRYLKKEVGVFGYKSYLPELKTPHITIYRVVDLARHRNSQAAAQPPSR